MSNEELSVNRPKKIGVVAGEASGDLLASGFLSHLHQSHLVFSAEGVAGQRMIDQGVVVIDSSDRLAVRGYWEVLRQYRGIIKIRDQLIQRWTQSEHRPDVFIGVDAPDFNLNLAQALKKKGIPTFQYVCPAIWAWRPERIHLIKRSLNHVWCLFPFEEPLLLDHGVEATYVGHPLAEWIAQDVDIQAARKKLNLNINCPVLALLPGSRKSEIAGLLQRFLHASQKLLLRHPDLQLVLPTLPNLYGEVKQLVEQFGLDGRVQVILGQSHDAIASADLVLVASGTATLEAALFKKPMIIAYHMPWLSWQITRRKMRLPWVGLPNILCRDWVVPELIQENCTVDSIVSQANELLLNQSEVIRIQTHFSKLHQLLRRPTHQLMEQTLSMHLNHAAAF